MKNNKVPIVYLPLNLFNFYNKLPYRFLPTQQHFKVEESKGPMDSDRGNPHSFSKEIA